MSTLDYLRHHIARAFLVDWLHGSSLLASNPAAPSIDRNRLSWDVIHVCLSFFHSNGFYLFSGEFTVLLDLLNTYHPGIVDVMGQNYSDYLYLYVFGICGPLLTSASYVEVIQNATEAAPEDTSYTIYFLPNTQDSYISYPTTLQLLNQDKPLIQVGGSCCGFVT